MPKELLEALKLYIKTFDDSFPMSCMACTGPDEIIKIIQECVEAKKDVYEMGFLSLDAIY